MAKQKPRIITGKTILRVLALLLLALLVFDLARDMIGQSTVSRWHVLLILICTLVALGDDWL